MLAVPAPGGGRCRQVSCGGLPLFSGLAPAQLDELLREAQSVRDPKGTAVFQQDEEAHSFLVLLHGHLRVFKLTPDGQQVVVRFVSPGEVNPLSPKCPPPPRPGPASS